MLQFDACRHIERRIGVFMTGIYYIECKKARKVYVGQSNDIERRWKQHRSELSRRKRYYNIELQKDWRKFKHDFNFGVLQECEESQLKDLEKNIFNFTKMLELNYTTLMKNNII